MAKKSKKKASKPAARSKKAAKKAARKAARPAPRAAARKSAGKAGKPSKVRKAKKKPAKAPARAVAKKAAKKAKKAAARTARPAAARRPVRKSVKSAGSALTGKRPNLDRERRTIREEEEMVPSPPSSLNMDRSASAARSGRAEFEQRLREHTSTGPAMTGGDVDADWEDAETVGDEAPGGDSPTPDQDIVDEIGRAVGVEYDDDEELQGGDELAERDRHRWELDPASKDDFEEE